MAAAHPPFDSSHHNASLGISLTLLAFFFFTLLDGAAKWLILGGYSVFYVGFVRYLGHFIITLLNPENRHNIKDIIQCENKFYIILRGVFLLSTTVFNFLALQYLPLALTTTLFFASPIFVCVFSILFFNDHIGVWRWGAVFIGFAGVVIAVNPFETNFHWAVILSIAAALCMTFYSMLTRKLSPLVSTNVLQFYAGAVGTVVLLYFGITEWRTPALSLDWALLLLMAVFGWLGHNLLTNAHRYALPYVIMPFSYAGIVFASVIDYIVFHNRPEWHTLCGAALIILSGLFILFREQKHTGAAQE